MDRLLASRIALVLFAMGLLILGILRRKAVARRVRAFFLAEDAPLNLAVFRIVLFAMLWSFSDLEQLRWFSQLPEEFRILPWGSRWWLFDALPINETWAAAAWTGLRVTAFLAMIGLWTRPAAAAAALLAVYVLGIPQLYGKVHHYHHLVWFAGILAASRCGDALSIDAFAAAWRRGGWGQVEPPGTARAYALPIRFVWLLIGVAYFFPGFWKWWASGIDWVVGDNLKYHLYEKWGQAAGWSPQLRVDQYPAIYQLAALGTIVFELGFLWCLFMPRLRPWLAVMGLAFHEGIKHVMQIRIFWTLQACYVTFVDWAGLLLGLGRRMFPEPLRVLYDGNCRLCRRTVALVRVADVLGRINYVNALDEEALRQHGVAHLDRTALLTDMHAVSGGRQWRGYDAYQAIALRVPLLWPSVPLLFFPPVAAVGRRVYRRVADSRTCEVAAGPQHDALAPQPGARPAGARAVVAVGVFLLAGNAYFGIRCQSSAWPLACYPTFRLLIVDPTVDSLQIDVVVGSGQSYTIDDAVLMRRATSGRWRNLLGSIMDSDDEAVRRARLSRLWRLLEETGQTPTGVQAVRFYRLVRSTLPEDVDAAPLRQELLWEMPL